MMDGFLMLVIVLVGFARLGVVIVMGTQNFFPHGIDKTRHCMYDIARNRREGRCKEWTISLSWRQEGTGVVTKTV